MVRAYLGSRQGCTSLGVTLNICADCDNWLDFQEAAAHRQIAFDFSKPARRAGK